MEKFTFFYGTSQCFSQWHKANFTVDDVKFNCAEQYMMFKKAELFGDKNNMERILTSTNPRDQKQYGREVKNFDGKLWDSKCKQFVLNGNHAKFSQNPAMLKELLATVGTKLVEASKQDKIWGIGLGMDDKRRFDKSKWQGTNWLGEVLTTLREEFLENKDA